MITWAKPLSPQFRKYCAVRSSDASTTRTYCGGAWPCSTECELGTDPVKCPACADALAALDVDFNDALSCVSVAWHRELRYARTWTDSVWIEWEDREEPVGCIVFAKAGAEYAFLIGDDCWDADDPRGEMIEALLDALEPLPVAKAPTCDCGDSIVHAETCQLMRLSRALAELRHAAVIETSRVPVLFEAWSEGDDT